MESRQTYSLLNKYGRRNIKEYGLKDKYVRKYWWTDTIADIANLLHKKSN
jgi:hypothetical protein